MKPRSSFRVNLRALAPVLLTFVIASLASPTLSQQTPVSSSTTYHSIREALQALKTTKDKGEQQRIYQTFRQIPVRDHDDLMALYDEAKHRQDAAPLITTTKSFDEYVNQGQIVSVRLKGVTDPAFHDDIAALLDRETKDLPKNTDIPMVPIGKIELGAGAKSAMRVVRIESLIEAAGDGKNEMARAALWRMVDAAQDAYFGQLAVVALGKIGKPEDLDRLILMIVKEPNLHFQFDDFGSMAIPRLLQEVRNTALPQMTQASLSGHLVQVANHDSLTTFVPLLHDPNKIMASAALNAISKSLTSSDEGLIRKMLKDPSLDIQMEAMHAINGRAWDEKFIPLLIDVLKNGPLNNVAADGLGQHRVKSAVGALENAVLHDPSPYTRKSAARALERINRN